MRNIRDNCRLAFQLGFILIFTTAIISCHAWLLSHVHPS